MPRVPWSRALGEEYRDLFETCIVRNDKSSLVDRIVSKIASKQTRYAAVGAPLGIPWYFIGVVHNMEASLSFKTHLHNGDPLRSRTVHVPSGRPKEGSPPFTWEQSASDALRFDRVDKWRDWSVPGILYKLEGYNGWGYRLYHPHVSSPYLWSFSNHYVSGKYVADGRWSDTAVSRQVGGAVLLRRMAERGLLGEVDDLGADARPPVRYATGKRKWGGELQVFLNQFPGIFVKVDGWPGEKTSDAFKKVTGHYLHGDPRSNS